MKLTNEKLAADIRIAGKKGISGEGISGCIHARDCSLPSGNYRGNLSVLYGQREYFLKP